MYSKTNHLGAAMGPLLTGVVEENLGWGSVFNMLMIASGVAILVSFDTQFV